MRRQAAELIQLVERELPLEFEVTGDHDAWPFVGVGLLSRSTSTPRHVMGAQQGGQLTDAATLARSLYQHIVHLAWLAADPSPARIEQWRKDDLVQRLKADTDVRALGHQVFTDADRASLQAEVDAMTGPRLRLADMATVADKHWAEKIPGLHNHTERDSLRGMYAVLYRRYSGSAHPGFIGLNPVVEDLTPTRRRVVIERDPGGQAPLGMATVLFALGLLVAAESIGWPASADVSAAFNR